MNHEVFKLDCCHCGHTIELSARERELVECPRCGGMLEIRWRDCGLVEDAAETQSQQQ